MAGATQKTVRFSRVVERSGRPYVHTLWLPPEKDRELQRAQKAKRVMTVAPGARGKTDVGLVGFAPDEKSGGQFLIFPKSLGPFEGARVVGIKFDLIDQPKLAVLPKTLQARQPRPSRRAKKQPAAAQPAPAPKPPGTEDNVVAFAPREREEPPAARERSAAASKPSAPPKPKRQIRTSAVEPDSGTAHHALVREVRRAMKDLEAGKSVAAYQRLERALRDSGS